MTYEPSRVHPRWRATAGRAALMLVVAWVCAACASPEPDIDPITNGPASPRPSAVPAPTRPLMVLPTLAPVAGSRNPIGLPPVKVATASAQPAHLRIQAINIDLRITAGDLNVGRELAAPSETLGIVWYSGSARPGMVGNAVLTGHLDWQGKPGAFFRLKELKPGDIIQIYAADGQQYLYTVDRSDLYPADNAPVADIMGARDTPLLTLITCEGAFDPVKHDYSHRRVVRAIWY